MELLDNSTDSALLYDGGKKCTIFVIDFGEHVFVHGDGEKRFRLLLQVRFFLLKKIKYEKFVLGCTRANQLFMLYWRIK